MPIDSFSLSILISNVAPLAPQVPDLGISQNPILKIPAVHARQRPGYELVTCTKAAACSPRRHGIARRHAREDGRIRDPQPVNAVNFQSAIHHRRCIAAHSRGTALMPEGAKPVAKEAFELIGIASGRCGLPNRKRSQRGGVSDLARDIQAVHEILQILGIAEVIRINSDGIVGTRPSQMDGATALGMHSDNQGPGVSW